ncbi:MAG: AMP-binding protein [Eubacteriales bacterium]|nr:AMP-binding protein [Eubacteriales bacterium]
MNESTMLRIGEIATRIRGMREILGWSEADMAEKTGLTQEEYAAYEGGGVDLPFTFIHNCALAFGMELTELLEGREPNLSSYTVTRRGEGEDTAREAGILIRNLAPRFRSKIAEPYWVRYEYDEKLQHQPIHLTRHSGQEFDLILRGHLKVQVGDHTEVLREGDSIYYDSATPHGMIAVDGEDCVFCAVVLPGVEHTAAAAPATVAVPDTGDLVVDRFVHTETDGSGALTGVSFRNTEHFNFGFDIIDAIAAKCPDKLALLHLDADKNERRFTYRDLKTASNRCVNYFRSLGIGRGDKVMLVLKRHYQFWFAMIALHKLGAVAIPATSQLKEHDFTYRFDAAGVDAILATADDGVPACVDSAAASCPTLKTKILVGGARPGWHDFDSEYTLYSGRYDRPEDAPGGEETALMFFTSGTTGNSKMAAHKHTYALGHFVTAKYWHCCERDGLHFTISDTGWGKSLWGKFYGQFMCEGAVFVYDFRRFSASDLLPLFAKYGITTFCAPPTMLRLMIKEDLSSYDLSSVRHMTTAGEALNPEVHRQFFLSTGLSIMEGFGQTETTLTIANLAGTTPKIGSMGKASPQYKIDLLDPEGKPVGVGEVGEICIDVSGGAPVGLFEGYYRDPERTREVWHDGYYHTGDTAWRDEDGYFFYVSRVDDVIKSSGYRIGPFEIESVIMELPYVLECGVSAAPDEVRGQVVKASIVLTRGTEPTEALKKEIQDYVKTHTAPYKYPRIVVFREELPKTVSGKIRRNLL